MNAPHLPPKSCSIKTRQKVKSLPWVFGMVVIALLSSITTSLVVVAWFYPQLIPETGVTGVRTIQQQDSKPEEALQRDVNERIVRLYDVRQKIDDTFYPPLAHITDGVLLSSDGWVAAYLPIDKAATPVTMWEVVDSQGIVHSVEEIVIDKKTNIAYINIAGEGYRVSSLFDWGGEMQGREVWAVASSWALYPINHIARTSQSAYPLHDSTPTHGIQGEAKEGSILFGDSGTVVGFIGSDGSIIPSWLVAAQLPRVLAGDPLITEGFPFTGRLVTTQIVENRSEELVGFYIVTSPTQVTSSTIGVGDVIVRIQNQEIDPMRIAQQIYAAPQRTRFTVLREGREVDIVLSKERVN